MLCSLVGQIWADVNDDDRQRLSWLSYCPRSAELGPRGDRHRHERPCWLGWIEQVSMTSRKESIMSQASRDRFLMIAVMGSRG